MDHPHVQAIVPNHRLLRDLRVSRSRLPRQEHPVLGSPRTSEATGARVARGVLGAHARSPHVSTRSRSSPWPTSSRSRSTSSQAIRSFHRRAAPLHGVGQPRSRRRQDGRRVIGDDYGHHRRGRGDARRSAERLSNRRVVVAFQPHANATSRCSRTSRALSTGRRPDRTDVYAAGEQPIPGASGQALPRPSGRTPSQLRYMETTEVGAALLRRRALAICDRAGRRGHHASVRELCAALEKEGSP